MENSFHMDEPVPDPEDFTTAEEEVRNRELLKHMKEQQAAHRKFKKQVELDQILKKEKEEEQNKRELIANKAYLDRRNALARQRSVANNERMQKLLSKVDNYMHQINKIDSIEKIKRDAQLGYLDEVEKKKRPKVTDDSINRLSTLNTKNKTLRDENKNKRQERSQADLDKKNKLAKATELNEKIQTILKVGFSTTQKDNTINANNNNFFQEEEQGQGTCMSPDAYNNTSGMGMNATNKTNTKKKTRFLSSINENADFSAEAELRNILKNDKNNMKKLLHFKQKHKNFDISPYLHTAQMNQIKSAQGNHSQTMKTVLHNPLASNIINEEDMKYPSYLAACKCNNSEYIQAHLLNAKNDMEVYIMVNQKDQYQRNGLMYLILHQNLTMVKLTLLSGVILSDCIDIYDRNIIHYCSLIENDLLLDILCHCLVFEYKEDFKGMSHYVEKCLQIGSLNEDMTDEAALKVIDDFDNIVENKEMAESFHKKKEEEEKKLIEEKEAKEKENDAYAIELKTKINGKANIIITNNANIPKGMTFKKAIKIKKIPIKRMINLIDIDGNCAIHYVAKSNDLEKMEILLYFHARIDILDAQGKRPIDLTTSSVIQQYLIKNEKSIMAKTDKGKLPQPNTNNITMNNNATPHNLSKSCNFSTILNMDKLKFYTSEQINEYSSGYEGNTYLIISVIQNNYDMFKYLLTEKEANVQYQNSSGLTVLHFIIQNQNYVFLSFLLNITPISETAEGIYQFLSNKLLYDRRDLFKTKTELTYTGQALKALDLETNNNINILAMSIHVANSLPLLRSIIILYNNQLRYFPDASPIDIVFNRQYGKTKQTLLLKALDKSNKEITTFLLEDEDSKQLKLDIHQGDIKGSNILHYAIRHKDKEMIKYLTGYDAEKNVLRTAKDAKGKIPGDYDTSKIFVNELLHIWDACALNDYHLLEKLVNELKYYTVNDILPISKNSPLHVAAYHMSDKACLFLIKNNCDIKLVNKRALTAMDLIKEKENDKKVKAFIRTFRRILNKEINEYIDLDFKTGNNNSVTMMNNTNNSIGNQSKLSEEMIKNKRVKGIIELIKTEINKRKINMKKIFDKLDKNKNGYLEGNEFECLFMVLDIPGVSKDDILLVNSYLDEDQNGLIDYQEFIKIVQS